MTTAEISKDRLLLLAKVAGDRMQQQIADTQRMIDQWHSHQQSKGFWQTLFEVLPPAPCPPPAYFTYRADVDYLGELYKRATRIAALILIANEAATEQITLSIDDYLMLCPYGRGEAE